MLREKVYLQLKKVPIGKVVTYKILAHSINSKAYRAIGSFMRTNKDPVNLPCFKVVCSDGEVGEYSGRGGIKRKIELLRKDGIEVKNNKVDLKKYLHKF
ncbi:MAG: MGMT family protein [Candidatus Woesearchaeota archaeon]|nr:MAG: MGMT family protein [Candidatus Woesearchaeota archaeon]